MKKLFFIFFVIIVYTQIGCAFVVTTAGSFLGNLGAELVMEELEEDQKNNDKKSPGKKL
tara:strand:+ start:58 stop:234 length:177 start_codon:yes stop_codon:yes gene_type:complete